MLTRPPSAPPPQGEFLTHRMEYVPTKTVTLIIIIVYFDHCMFLTIGELMHEFEPTHIVGVVN